MNRSTRRVAAPVAALLLIGGAAVVPLTAMETVAYADMSPGPGLIWCDGHGEWHEDRNKPRFDPLRIGPIAPPGKVWVPEHGHFHDLPGQ